MGIPVLIMGESGSGKSTSLRNFEENEIGIFNVANKPLPFRKKLRVCENKTYYVQQKNEKGEIRTFYDVIKDGMLKSKCNAFVIDDSQYLLSFELFNRAKEVGYNKFTEIAYKFYDLLRFIIERLPQNKIVYFLHHSETTEQGRTKAKTVGKMLDNQLCVEGQFAIVIYCATNGISHWFETQTDGFTTAKSPMGLFEEKQIDNDLKLVDTKIREYWNL